ncbi:MAG: c-type cytochrome [Ardenticatenaceae bacterium]
MIINSGRHYVAKMYGESRSAAHLMLRTLFVLQLVLLTGCGAKNDEQVVRGKALYEANCASCHGIEGEGAPNWQQPDATGAFPAPPHDGSGHTWHHPDQQLLQIIAEGGPLSGSQMPPFGDELTQEEMEAILAYIKTFWSPEQRETQADITRRAQ